MADELALVPKAVIKILEGVSEAFEGVTDLGEPSQGESLSDLHTRLLTTRAAMSRVSELVAQMIRLRGLVDQALIVRRGDLEDAEAKVLSEDTKKSFVEDYSSAKERNAKLAAKTLDERRAVRQGEKAMSDVVSGHEYVKNRLWELDRAVRDIDTRLRIISYEPNVQ